MVGFFSKLLKEICSRIGSQVLYMVSLRLLWVFMGSCWIPGVDGEVSKIAVLMGVLKGSREGRMISKGI